MENTPLNQIGGLIQACLNVVSTLARALSPGRSDPRIMRKCNQLMGLLKQLYQEDLLDGEVLIAQGNSPLLHLRNRDIADDAQFMIGSVSKQFFAALLLRTLYDLCPALDEKSKVSAVKKQLNQPILDFLPGSSPLWSATTPIWTKKVTLHHLLTHTSGIPNYTDSDNYRKCYKKDGGEEFREAPHSAQEILKLIAKEPPLFKPGSDYNYCNTEYLLIAQIISALTQKPISEYIRSNIFAPLEMTSSYNPSEGNWEELHRNPHCNRLVPPLCYDPRNQDKVYPLKTFENVCNAQGTGSIISNASDLLKWNLGLHRDQVILPPSLYRLMVTAYQEEYGYGIGVSKTDGNPIYGHQGEIAAYQSYLLYLPKQELSLIVLCHIKYDWDKLDAEYDKIFDSLRREIKDEDERDEATEEEILDKYPPDRGFDLIAENIDDLF